LQQGAVPGTAGILPAPAAGWKPAVPGSTARPVLWSCT